ncbi:hypothetical protein AMELA_G00144110 [Ameiurus melas]|uniref:Uncharacterized protein n=1 Tax=Ameiurus melas TaxID=219545 RepID=A0A7J6AKY8_AMEME|nr:hypothetical protein AMELA_G00144110 [Ameiurus melas]
MCVLRSNTCLQIDICFYSNSVFLCTSLFCHYGSEVFRLCRKQSNEADNTDDENGEIQVSMETKQRSRTPQAQVIRSQFSGGEKKMIGRNCPIVDREILALGSRAPSLQDPFQSGRKANAGCVQSPPVRHLGVEELVRASQISVYYPAVESEESTSLASDYYGSVFSLYRQRTFSVYSVQE